VVVISTIPFCGLVGVDLLRKELSALSLDMFTAIGLLASCASPLLTHCVLVQKERERERERRCGDVGPSHFSPCLSHVDAVLGRSALCAAADHWLVYDPLLLARVRTFHPAAWGPPPAVTWYPEMRERRERREREKEEKEREREREREIDRDREKELTIENVCVCVKCLHYAVVTF